MVRLRNHLRWICFALVVVAGAFAYPWIEHKLAEAIRETRLPVTGKSAPDFTLRNAAGAEVRLSEYKGRVVLLNFWATWCGPCKIETPWFIEFQQKYAKQGFTVLGVSMDDDGWQVVTPWLKEQGVNYPIVLGNSDIYGGMEALPTTFMIGRDGKITATHTGLIPKLQYENEITTLLGVDSAQANR